jgi:hypothetical protein
MTRVFALTTGLLAAMLLGCLEALYRIIVDTDTGP